jgi:hypothetical protein
MGPGNSDVLFIEYDSCEGRLVGFTLRWINKLWLVFRLEDGRTQFVMPCQVVRSELLLEELLNGSN